MTSAGHPGLLYLVMYVMKSLGLCVSKAKIDYEDGILIERFWVSAGPGGGSRITDEKDLENVKKILMNAICQCSPLVAERSIMPKRRMPAKIYEKPGLSEVESMESRRRSGLLFGLMDQYLKNDVYSIQKSIVDHVEYTIARSRFQFDDFEAYQVSQHRFSFNHCLCRSLPKGPESLLKGMKEYCLLALSFLVFFLRN
jgi:starch phosphorylase